MHYVYIIYLNTTNQLYAGSTGNLKIRIKEHLVGKVRSTNKKRPILIHYETYKLKSDALRRERFLKTTEGKRLLRQQLKDVLKMHKYNN